MPPTSSGILLFRRRPNGIEVLLVHPGGPFWKNKDTGFWSIPKGLVNDDEDLLACACREFEEEIGVKPTGPFIPLSPVKLKSGKIVHAWACEGDLDPATIKSNTFTIEWPLHSGQQAEFPEIDRGDWFTMGQAREKLSVQMMAGRVARRIAIMLCPADNSGATKEGNMGWDIFISHASEDKAAVAVPLKEALEGMGISVWIDMDQIKLGDSFRSKIDFALQRCRFGVVVLSPTFFQKAWAKAELDALLNMEMTPSGQKRLLPVLYRMSFSELQSHSPLLAGRLAVRWEDGLPKVIKAIVDAASVTTTVPSGPLVPPSVHHSPVSPSALVLFQLADGSVIYCESLNIEYGTGGINLSIKCTGPADTAFVQKLGRTGSESVAVAFGTTAMLGQVSEAVLKRTGSQETGVITLKNVGRQGGNWMEMSFGGYSNDQIAELRARRILLNEKLPSHKGKLLADTANLVMLESFVAGDGAYKVTASVIPKLYHQLSSNPDTFVAVARLACVMALCLSDAVESILRLDLRLVGHQLEVDFAGKRAKKYSNVDPPIIEVRGLFDLK